jgi:hypothetical protein
MKTKSLYAVIDYILNVCIGVSIFLIGMATYTAFT